MVEALTSRPPDPPSVAEPNGILGSLKALSGSGGAGSGGVEGKYPAAAPDAEEAPACGIRD